MANPVTRSRTYGLVREQKEGGNPEEGKPTVYKFRANDGEFDRYNDRLNIKGWKLDDFNANPVIFYNHDSGLGLCDDRKTLPIGKARAYVEGDALMVDIEFDQDDEFAKAVESKVAKGILNAVSVGYRMVEGKYRENEKSGWDCDEQELLEISVVTIPGNQRALRIKAAQDARQKFADDIIERAVDRVVKVLEQRLAPPAPEPIEVKITSTAYAAAPAEVKAETKFTDSDIERFAEHTMKFLKEKR